VRLLINHKGKLALNILGSPDDFNSVLPYPVWAKRIWMALSTLFKQALEALA
jgi:hypothetical protein